MNRRKHLEILTLLTAVVLVLGCVPAIGPDPGGDPDPGGGEDPVTSEELSVVPDDATVGSNGAGTFFAVVMVADGSVSLVSSDATDPSGFQTLIDGQINAESPYVRLSGDSGKVAYLNVNRELVVLDRSGNESHVVATYAEGARDMDEFWWYNNSVLLFSAGGPISRAAIADGTAQVSTIFGSYACNHDLALNWFSAHPGGATIALTYISGSFATVYVGEYLDDGTTGDIIITSAIVSHVNEFGIDFDPMLTWLTEDHLVWRTNESVSALLYCNVPAYLDPDHPDHSNALGSVSVDSAIAPTDFLLSPDAATIYLFGRGNAVAALPVPSGPGSYDASVFYTDNIEYTVSKLAFSPSGKYFLVGNMSRLRVFSTTDPSVRYRWWEDTELETDLDTGVTALLQIWWK